jgi:hypothetical protein
MFCALDQFASGIFQVLGATRPVEVAVNGFSMP